MNPKQLVGEKATEYIKDGMIVGLGTGSTAVYAIQKIGQLVKDGLKIQAVPTSKATEQLARELNIPLLDIDQVRSIDLAIDGADEFDPQKNLIKGGGGALLREKIVASISKEFICIADLSKSSPVLGSYPLPVEVTPFASELTAYLLSKLGCTPVLRTVNGTPFITDNQNYIIDCKFEKIEDPATLTIKLNQIPGVVENGLFANMATRVICNTPDGEIQVIE
ncbi:ribose-5-phosphate isomerase RpiA [Mangrovibacterium marinum]|uniref:Ribose-5-phosphate isomerase A n=1 Tax=Mangrovibacterium marinum TaxID=1639118 RepID=A0A2T5C4H6_9BACT|nr:ribose-5-phosphate isomerase RpiA [Mangrovibacterium marinum]PTN09737.1 ribose-5-phosphate isomerase [Mangrovibacterium marinum]